MAVPVNIESNQDACEDRRIYADVLSSHFPNVLLWHAFKSIDFYHMTV